MIIKKIFLLCLIPNYKEQKWPDDYWPRDAAPHTDAAWDDAVAGFTRDREQLRQMIRDRQVDLFAVQTEAHAATLRLIRQLVPEALDAGDPTPMRQVLFRIHVDEVTGRASSTRAARAHRPSMSS